MMQAKGLRSSGHHNLHDDGNGGNCDAFFERSDFCASDDDAGSSSHFSGASLSISVCIQLSGILLQSKD